MGLTGAINRTKADPPKVAHLPALPYSSLFETVVLHFLGDSLALSNIPLTNVLPSAFSLVLRRKVFVFVCSQASPLWPEIEFLPKDINQIFPF